MDYWTDKDYGAAIFNSGTVICFNCSFINNYAKYGGAIYNKGTLVLQNCSFANNTGYGSGNDVVNTKSGVVMLNRSIISGSEGPVEYLVNNENYYWLVAIGDVAVFLSLVSGFAGFAIAGLVFHCLWASSLAVGIGAGVVCGAGVSVAASFIGSSITGVDVTTILKAYVPLCVAAGIAGAIIGAYAFPNFAYELPFYHPDYVPSIYGL